MSQRERVLASLFAATGHDKSVPLRHHPSEADRLRAELDVQFMAVRWLLACQRDRDANGPVRPVYMPESRRAA